MHLLQNADCYCPEPIGKRDILIAGGKIIKIMKPGQAMWPGIVPAIDCESLYAFPGMIDQHVHIIGGGGEGGVESSILEINIDDILRAGVTTVVGVLGMDSYTKSLHQLYAKAKSLELQGITTYIYTGSYAVPGPTLTRTIIDDLVLIDKAIGAGEVAISDHRSTLVSIEDLIKIASQAHVGGLLGGKAGVVHFHVGDGKGGLDPLFSLLERTDLHKEQFVPTHVNRNERLFCHAIQYSQQGGMIDLTAGETAGVAVPDAIKRLTAMNVELNRVTISSDADGSIPSGGVSRIQTLYDDVRACLLNGISPEVIFRCVTENVARLLRLYPAKGVLSEGSDADILLLDRQYNLVKLFSKGNLLMDNGQIVRQGA